MKQPLFHSIFLYSILATEVLLGLVPSVAAQQDDCPEGYPGDGYCDAECNTAMHDWDKGDCCEETCVDDEYECGRYEYDCKSSSNTNIFKLTKAYKGFVLELACEKGKSGYATRYNYTMYEDTHNYARRKSFHLDNDLETACQQTSTKTYKHPECIPSGNRRKSQFCYDRGHIVMADHMDSDPVTMYESNTMTNIVPQASGFNQAGGAWRFTEDLIECTRDMASIDKQVIFGGMIYDDSSNDYFLESHGIPTPDLYWKVVTRYFKSAPSWKYSASLAATPEVIAWIFPNAFDAGR
jgi:endonuclease G